MRAKPYPSDLTDARWAILKPHLPPTPTCGRPRKTDLREVLNAIFYRNRNGCTWRALPHDFPPWRTVYNYFQKWRDDGTWQAINDALRVRVRQKADRPPTPSAGSIDSCEPTTHRSVLKDSFPLPHRHDERPWVPPAIASSGVGQSLSSL